MMNSALILIFQLIVFLFSVMIHEVSHGLMAYRLGDQTAKKAGRLTLNPLKHLDYFGSFFVPFLLFIFKSPVLFGWAKPVPYNPFNLKNPKRDSGLIGIAGPLSNLSIALIFGLINKSFIFLNLANAPLLIFLDVIILINVALAIFNLVPISPLDGSKILFAILPDTPKTREFYEQWERYGIFILLFFLFFGIQFIVPIIDKIYSFLGSGALFNF
ncbi:site-2 protease family protein [Candidatus Wolfebacteria bacterium]|nr:site-2 protease family protein [Candidatus Wolfebacteria bacterium]